MVSMINDPFLEQQFIAERQATGADRYDEVWEGVYMMAPMPNLEHQNIAMGISNILYGLFDAANLGETFAGCNVSSRRVNWKQDFRCPDVALYLNDTDAERFDAFWFGGPDFAVEICSPDDRTHDKLVFYAKINTRELLIIDRDPWSLELYRLADEGLQLVDKSTLDKPNVLTSQVVPVVWKLVPGEKRPQIEVVQSENRQEWTI